MMHPLKHQRGDAEFDGDEESDVTPAKNPKDMPSADVIYILQPTKFS